MGRTLWIRARETKTQGSKVKGTGVEGPGDWGTTVQGIGVQGTRISVLGSTGQGTQDPNSTSGDSGGHVRVDLNAPAQPEVPHSDAGDNRGETHVTGSPRDPVA